MTFEPTRFDAKRDAQVPKERSTAIGKARRMQRRQDVSLTPGSDVLATVGLPPKGAVVSALGE